MESRTKNGIRNIGSGIINRILLIVFPFITRTILLYSLGSEYLGLNSLFTSILTVLNLAELGFGSALVFSMYKPIAENDKKKICALLSVYKKIFVTIGILIAILGIAITPFIPKIINGDIPANANIYILYIIYLSNTVVSYIFFAHKRALLIAYQRNDIVTNINSVISILLYCIQTVILLLCHNYYLYILFMPILTIVENIVVARKATKLFPEINCSGKISKSDIEKIKQHIKGLAIQNICSASRNSFDSIVISLYLGLNSIAIYNNYFFIMNAIHSLLYQIPNSIRATVGNSIASESIDKNYKLFNVMTLLYQWASGWCLTCLMCLYQPFMKIWMGEKMLCEFSTVILFCIYFFELCMSDIIVLYKDGAGLWWQGRYRTSIEAVANLFLNFFLGWLYGTNGIILATIITMTIIGHGYGGYIVFHYYFKTKKYLNYIFLQLRYFAVIFSVSAITYTVCSYINDTGVNTLLIKGIICIFIPNLLYLVIFKFSNYFDETVIFVKNIIYSIKK